MTFLGTIRIESETMNARTTLLAVLSSASASAQVFVLSSSNGVFDHRHPDPGANQGRWSPTVANSAANPSTLTRADDLRGFWTFYLELLTDNPPEAELTSATLTLDAQGLFPDGATFSLWDVQTDAETLNFT